MPYIPLRRVVSFLGLTILRNCETGALYIRCPSGRLTHLFGDPDLI